MYLLYSYLSLIYFEQVMYENFWPLLFMVVTIPGIHVQHFHVGVIKIMHMNLAYISFNSLAPFIIIVLRIQI